MASVTSVLDLMVVLSLDSGQELALSTIFNHTLSLSLKLDMLQNYTSHSIKVKSELFGLEEKKFGLLQTREEGNSDPVLIFLHMYSALTYPYTILC